MKLHRVSSIFSNLDKYSFSVFKIQYWLWRRTACKCQEIVLKTARHQKRVYRTVVLYKGKYPGLVKSWSEDLVKMADICSAELKSAFILTGQNQQTNVNR